MKRILVMVLVAVTATTTAQTKHDAAERHADKAQMKKGLAMIERDTEELQLIKKNLKTFQDAYNAINVEEMNRARKALLGDMDREIRQAEEKMAGARRELHQSKREVASDQREIREHKAKGEHARAAGDRADKMDDKADMRDDRSDRDEIHKSLRRMKEIRKAVEELTFTSKPMNQREGQVRVLVEEFIGIMQADIAATKEEVGEDRRELKEDRGETREGRREEKR